MKKCLCFLFLICLFACGSSTHSTYRIGMDPSFYPLNLGAKDVNVFAFFNDFIAAIAKEENIKIETVTRSWDNVLDGLETGSYQGAFSSMTPRAFNKKIYSFSDIVLPTGPVLITTKGSSIQSLKDLNNKIVAAPASSSAFLQLSHNPTLQVEPYNQVSQALNQLLAGEYQAVAVDIISAISYVKDLYEGQLVILDEFLIDEGVRIVTMHDKDPAIIHLFNEGLKKLKEKGIYQHMLKKWSVGIN